MTKILNQEVLERYMSPSELKSFMDTYQSHLKRHLARVVNDKDFLVLNQWKAGVKDLKHLAQTNNISIDQVKVSLRLAALSSLEK